MSLLLIFFFNLVATTLADAAHIEIETHSSAIEHSHDHGSVKSKKSSKSKPLQEHCDEHEECHQTHFHHYIYSAVNTVAAIKSITSESFIENYSHYRSYSLDIIKPPLV